MALCCVRCAAASKVLVWLDVGVPEPVRTTCRGTPPPAIVIGFPAQIMEVEVDVREDGSRTPA